MTTLLAGASGIMDMVFSIVGTLLYPLFSVIFLFIDAIQMVFKAFAGIGDTTFAGTPIGSGNSGAENDTGIVYYLFQNSLVKNMLMSIMLLALFLIIIFTVMAFIKNVYAAKQKGWKEIIGNSIKGLANFIFLPVCCLLGVWLGNILLNAIDGATSLGDTQSMSRRLFIVCAYNANEFRVGKATEEDWQELHDLAVDHGYKDANKIVAGLTKDQYADFVDDIYAQTDVDIWNQVSVGRWYQVWQINYLILVVGGIFMLWALCSLAFAMVRRMFLLIILFIISPGVCALYPLDEGKAVGSWKGEFIKQVLSAYGAVAGLNIFFSIMPLIDKIQVYGSGFGGWFMNDIIQIFVLIVGLLCVKEVVGLISGFVGGEDALGKGSSLMKSTKEKALSGAKKAAKYGGVFQKPIVGVSTGLWNIGKGAYNSTIGKGVDAFGRYRDKRRAKKEEEYQKQFEGKSQQEIYDSLFGEDNKKSVKRQDRAVKRADRREKRQESWEKFKDSDFVQWNAKAGKKVGGAISKAGKAVVNSDFGQAVGGELKKLPGGLKSLSSALYEESGLKKEIQGITGEYDSAIDRQKARDKKAKDGRLGENKIIGALNKLAEKGGGRIDEMSTSVIRALGESFGEVLSKKLIGGKLSDKGAYATTLGLDKTSTQADLATVDSVLSRLHTFADRINASTGVAREEYIKGAIEFARNTDSAGNDQLQKALDQAFNQFTVDGLKDGGTVKLDEGTIKAMTEASKEAGRIMAREMQTNTRRLMSDVDAEKRKKS